MQASQSSRATLAFTGLYRLGILIFLATLVYNHTQLITHEYPLDYNESGMLTITSTLVEGSSPFARDNQPIRISVYPVAYNLLVAPFVPFAGNTLEVHRAVAAVFILACAALCYVVCRRNNATRTDSIAAACLIYGGLLFYSTPIASPNSLGTLLFLCAAAIPWMYRFSSQSLAVALVLGILAYFTKQYFIAALGYVALYTFLTVSKSRALLFGLASVAALALSLLLVANIAPYYIDNTLFIIQAGAAWSLSNDFVFPQFVDFGKIYYPLLAVLVLALLYHWWTREAPTADTRETLHLLQIRELNKPLIHQQPDYFLYCCACSVLIVVFALGKNPGNHVTYLMQVILPFLVIGVVNLITLTPKLAWLFRCLLVIAMCNSYILLAADFSVEDKNWQKIRQEIAAADHIYASTLVLPDVLAQGKPIYLNGHTRYFSLGSMKSPRFTRENKSDRVAEIWEDYVNHIASKIRNREFDLLVMDNWMHLPSSLANPDLDLESLLGSHYEQTDAFGLHLVDRPGGGSYRIKLYRPSAPPVPSLPAPQEKVVGER